jgi:ubiquinone/menaquinone biosynthesis C-methylase UbiE
MKRARRRVEEGIAEFDDYRPEYFERLATEFAEDSPWKRNRMTNVMTLSEPKTGEIVLDLGCAVGTFTIETKKRGAFVIGLDYAPSALKIAKRLDRRFGSGDATFVAGDVRWIPAQDNTINLVIAADLTEHLNTPILRTMLAEVKRVLRPGGRLAIYTPSPTHVFELMMRADFILRRDESHIGLRTLSTLVREAEHVGLSIKEYSFLPTHIPVFSSIERMLSRVPVIGVLFRRRIALLAIAAE